MICRWHYFPYLSTILSIILHVVKSFVSIKEDMYSRSRLQKSKLCNIRDMKKEYDFSKGERGKFYRPNLRLNIPIYLEEDIADFVQKFARKKKVDTQTVVNQILRRNKELIQLIQ